jgi:hypothetical protein
MAQAASREFLEAEARAELAAVEHPVHNNEEEEEGLLRGGNRPPRLFESYVVVGAPLSMQQPLQVGDHLPL